MGVRIYSRKWQNIPYCQEEFFSPNRKAGFLQLFSFVLSSGVAIEWTTGHGLHSRPGEMIGVRRIEEVPTPTSP